MLISQWCIYKANCDFILLLLCIGTVISVRIVLFMLGMKVVTSHGKKQTETKQMNKTNVASYYFF